MYYLHLDGQNVKQVKSQLHLSPPSAGFWFGLFFSTEDGIIMVL
jgi:hypothetical protein